jgi:hypothetical protein
MYILPLISPGLMITLPLSNSTCSMPWAALKSRYWSQFLKMVTCSAVKGRKRETSQKHASHTICLLPGGFICVHARHVGRHPKDAHLFDDGDAFVERHAAAGRLRALVIRIGVDDREITHGDSQRGPYPLPLARQHLFCPAAEA